MGSDSVIIGGENYGQGSSREHAAINPMYLGVKCCYRKEYCPYPQRKSGKSWYRSNAYLQDPADYDRRLIWRDELEI